LGFPASTIVLLIRVIIIVNWPAKTNSLDKSSVN
jgi:hypothetical protein